MEAFWDKIRLLLFCIMYVVLFPVAAVLTGMVLGSSLGQFLIIILLFLFFALRFGIFRGFLQRNRFFAFIRAFLSAVGIIAFIISYFVAVYLTAGEWLYVFNGITAVNVIFLLIFIILLFDRLWLGLDYFFDRNIRIGLFHGYRWETLDCIIELIKEKGINNIYCYNKTPSNDENIFHICVIREIDNSIKNYNFIQFLFDNYAGADWFSYSDFIDFANKNGMFLRTYNLSKPLDNPQKHLNILMKENGIKIKPKKLNINEASLQEIINLPFINIVTAKKIIKHKEETGDFKSFWEFAKFLKLNENQGTVLSKLVFVKQVKEAETDDKNNEYYEYKRDLDL